MITSKVKILILAANPVNTFQLRLGEEVRSIQAELERARYRDWFELVSYWAVRVSDLSRALLEHKPQIVHFSGHGLGNPTFQVQQTSRQDAAHALASDASRDIGLEPEPSTVMSEGLVLEDEQGRAKLVSTEALAGLFELFQNEVKCVVLNACYSETQARAIHQHIDCVVGMNKAIGDRAAIQFSTEFYKALVTGQSFTFAHQFARNGLDLSSTPESLTPVLLNRRGSDDPFHLKTSTPDSGLPVTMPASQLTTYSDRDVADPETVKRIVQEELRIAHTEYGEPVSQGLTALTDLMQAPKVRDAVITFRVVFEAACDQISVVANYKALHDLLHTLEFQCYSGILQESKRFPDDETALDILMEHELTLQTLLGDMQKVTVRETIATHEVQWLSDLQKAQMELHGAIDALDIRRLQRAIWLLNRVLAIQPSRINTNLTGAARSLRLPDLVNAMTFIAEKLTGANLNQEKLKQFQHGVSVLAVLGQRLTALISGHDDFQELDLELRRIEANLEQNLTELEMSWPDLQARGAELVDGEADEWTIAFQQDSQNLDTALNDQNPVKIRRYFRLYRRRASGRFYQVDVTLKRLCEELREVGEPLASVLRIIE